MTEKRSTKCRLPDGVQNYDSIVKSAINGELTKPCGCNIDKRVLTALDVTLCRKKSNQPIDLNLKLSRLALDMIYDLYPCVQ